MTDKIIQAALDFLTRVFVYPEIVTTLIAILPIVEARLAIPIGLGLGMGYLKSWAFAFIGSSLACVSVILTAGVALFPFILPSSEMPKASLTAWDATSSHFTLNVMLWVALIFTPIVVAYTGWAYRVMSGKVTRDFIVKNDKTAY